MKKDLTIVLSSDLKADLEAAASDIGQPAEVLAQQAIADYLFSRQFRTLRAYLLEKSPENYTDEDIFDLIS
jgi:predicted transcriptional regulator